MFKQLNSAIPFKADSPTRSDTAQLLPSRNVQQITPAPPPPAARTRLHADTHSLYQGPCLCRRVSALSKLFAVCVSTLKAAQVAAHGRARVPCPCDLRRCPRVLPFFFFFSIFRANLCLYVCVCGSLCGSPHERPARPRTMRWASAEETHLCPTPTNRKPRSRPPRPAFASQARRKRHGEGECNHATQRHGRALWKSTYVGFSRGCDCVEKPMNVAINWVVLRRPAGTPR